MVRYDSEGKIEGAILNDDGTLSERIINSYDYIKMKNDFERIIDIMFMNQLAHELYKEQLKYEVDDNLEFVVFYDNQDRLNTNIAKRGMTGVVTYSKQYYETSTRACIDLLAKVKYAQSHLNEVERFIIKSLEFDNPVLSNEELEESLATYKNKLFVYKKSGYIKLGVCLKLNNDKLDPEEYKRNMYDFIKWRNEQEDIKLRNLCQEKFRKNNKNLQEEPRDFFDMV